MWVRLNASELQPNTIKQNFCLTLGRNIYIYIKKIFFGWRDYVGLWMEGLMLSCAAVAWQDIPDLLQFCPEQGRMSFVSCCAVIFSIPSRPDWQHGVLKRGRASSCAFLTGETCGELSGTGSGGGAGSRNASTWASRLRIWLVPVILTSKPAKIRFKPERLSSRWSTSRILHAPDIRFDACGARSVH